MQLNMLENNVSLCVMGNRFVIYLLPGKIEFESFNALLATYIKIDVLKHIMLTTK